jgi:molybdate-binding protein/DNA-binding XRE family transcriptional regulator
MANVSAVSQVHAYRIARQWSQSELAHRTGISRAAVSAIETNRLTPSVRTALALASAFGCSVEQLFGTGKPKVQDIQWAWPAPTWPARYWEAEVGGRRWRYPVEFTGAGDVPPDGVCRAPSSRGTQTVSAEQVLMIATCDPAVGLLASQYAHQTAFRLLPLTRSSGHALRLLAEGKVHAAGVHLSSDSGGGNAEVVRAADGTARRLLRIGVWEEGLAFTSHLRIGSIQAARKAKLKWVGRELGSGARQCLDLLLEGRTPPRRLAPDHRSVAMAIRCGWADAGVCLRLASEEAGLGFLALRCEAYDLCFPASLENDPRVQALVDVVQSVRYRRLLSTLPGYAVRTTGNLRSC